MHNFIKPFVAPVMKRRKWNRICEIGSSLGEATELLRGIPRLEITTIDPCVDCDLQQKFASDARIDIRKGLSLEVLPTLDNPYDCILIDGDHNWYTVYNELRVISERNLLRKGGIIFFHDVTWPWARRDLYYSLDTIPEKYRNPWTESGIVRAKNELPGDSGMFAGFKKSVSEGGEHNGVLTAIEDFRKQHKGEYLYFGVIAGSGLGIMLYRGGFWDELSFLALAFKGVVYNAAFRALQVAKGKIPARIPPRDAVRGG
jgi:hypothetical protein